MLTYFLMAVFAVWLNRHSLKPNEILKSHSGAADCD